MRTQRKLSQKLIILLIKLCLKKKKPVVFFPIQNLQWDNLEFYEKVVVQEFSLSRLKSKLRSKDMKENKHF